MTSVERAFLATLRDDPSDDTNRLIYADWLEERGDPRAEYLRLEYEVRVRGVDGKARLDALRPRLDPDWLWAVQDGRLGPDWALVLQSYLEAHRDEVVDLVWGVARMSQAHAETVVQPGTREIVRGLLYWEANALRQAFVPWAYVTVEYRPRPPIEWLKTRRV